MTQRSDSGTGNAANAQIQSNADDQRRNTAASSTIGASNVSAPAPKKGKTGILVAVIAVVIVILAVVMFSGSGNFGSTEDGADTVEETTANGTADTESDTSENTDTSDADITDTEDAQSVEISAARISGSVTGNNLTFSIDQEESFDLTVYYENNSDVSFAFGWTSSTYIVVTTDSGIYTEELGTEYSAKVMQVYPGESGSFNVYFDDAEGMIQSVKINNICILGDNGQPANKTDMYTSYTIDITYDE